jgi:hypothetical protein
VTLACSQRTNRPPVLIGGSSGSISSHCSSVVSEGYRARRVTASTVDQLGRVADADEDHGFEGTPNPGSHVMWCGRGRDLDLLLASPEDPVDLVVQQGHRLVWRALKEQHRRL